MGDRSMEGTGHRAEEAEVPARNSHQALALALPTRRSPASCAALPSLARSPEAGAHIGVQLQLLAQGEVEGAEALANGGGHGPLQANAVLLRQAKQKRERKTAAREGGGTCGWVWEAGGRTELRCALPQHACHAFPRRVSWLAHAAQTHAAGTQAGPAQQVPAQRTSTESRFSRVTKELVRGSTSVPMRCQSHTMGALAASKISATASAISGPMPVAESWVKGSGWCPGGRQQGWMQRRCCGTAS